VLTLGIGVNKNGPMRGPHSDYGDLIERWKVDLIRMRAKRFLFRKDEIPDLEQSIVMELMNVDYRPDAPGGASEATFVIAVIDRQLRNIKRYRAREKRRWDYEALSIEDGPNVWDEIKSLSVEQDDQGLRLDQAHAMRHVRPVEREICAALGQGQKQAAVARATGRSRAAVCEAVRTARRSLRLVTPYSIPPESMLSAVQGAALAGVEVEIVVPSSGDSWLGLWAGRSSYRNLIEAGVRIYEYREGMLHGKLAIVDDHWCTAGSANLDCRSFRLAFEVNCFIYDPEASRSLTTLFEAYRSKATPVTDPAQYDQRLGDRLRCGFTRLASPLL